MAFRNIAATVAIALLGACAQDAIATDAGLDASHASDAGLDASQVPMPDADVPSTDGGSQDAADPRDAGMLAPEGCITAVSAGHHVFDCDGIAYDVELASACAAGGCGLVLDVHGATMNADDEDRNTNMRALGAARGYVVVQPTAPDGTIGPSWDPARDDPKVFSFLELALRVFQIDPDRVHMTGFSQGGFMTWRMLCEHADIFASVAPAAACGALFPGCAFSSTERPAREIPVLYVHGSNDLIVSGCAETQRDAVVSGWAMTVDTVVSSDADHTWTRYRSASGNTFEYIEHSYSAYSYVLGGHCFPGSPDIGTNRFTTDAYGCEDLSPFHWGEAVIAFFEAHAR